MSTLSPFETHRTSSRACGPHTDLTQAWNDSITQGKHKRLHHARPQTAPIRRGIQHFCPGREGIPGWIHNKKQYCCVVAEGAARELDANASVGETAQGCKSQTCKGEGFARLIHWNSGTRRHPFSTAPVLDDTRSRRQPSTGARAGFGGWERRVGSTASLQVYLW